MSLVVSLIVIRDHYESCSVLSVMVFGNHYGSCCTNRGRCQFSINEPDIVALWIVLFSGPWFILLSLPICPFQSSYATSVFRPFLLDSVSCLSD